jgi:hypothetical protein
MPTNVPNSDSQESMNQFMRSWRPGFRDDLTKRLQQGFRQENIRPPFELFLSITKNRLPYSITPPGPQALYPVGAPPSSVLNSGIGPVTSAGGTGTFGTTPGLDTTPGDATTPGDGPITPGEGTTGGGGTPGGETTPGEGTTPGDGPTTGDATTDGPGEETTPGDGPATPASTGGGGTEGGFTTGAAGTVVINPPRGGPYGGLGLPPWGGTEGSGETGSSGNPDPSDPCTGCSPTFEVPGATALPGYVRTLTGPDEPATCPAGPYTISARDPRALLDLAWAIHDGDPFFPAPPWPRSSDLGASCGGKLAAQVHGFQAEEFGCVWSNYYVTAMCFENGVVEALEVEWWNTWGVLAGIIPEQIPPEYLTYNRAAMLGFTNGPTNCCGPGGTTDPSPAECGNYRINNSFLGVCNGVV